MMDKRYYIHVTRTAHRVILLYTIITVKCLTIVNGLARRALLRTSCLVNNRRIFQLIQNVKVRYKSKTF